MKKKLLVAGTNIELVKEFIEHSEIYFQSISTTDCHADVKLHFELFKPDGYLLFPESPDDEMILQINDLKKELDYECPIFICAQSDVCEMIQQNFHEIAQLLLKRPVSADNILLRLLKFFDEPVHRSDYENNNISSFDFNDTENIDESDTERSESVSGHKKHILIVDDDRMILKMLKSVLEDKYTVTTMVNGILVEKFLSTRNIDLMILDYEMPVKTGAEVIRSLQFSDITKKFPVCFLTGVDKQEQIMEILSLKPDAYITKPVDMKSFLATISNLID